MRLGSLCTGIGGLDRSAEQVFGAETHWHCEIDRDASKVLARHFPDVPNIGDMKAVDWASVPPVDVLTAGYPCQPFSSAGQRKGTDDPRHLWPSVLVAIRVLRPRYVFVENVAAHVSLGFDRVLADLAAAGVDAEWALVRASDVGACHRRSRLFVLATDAASDTRGFGYGDGGPATDSYGPPGWEVTRGALGDEGPDEGWGADGADVTRGGVEAAALGLLPTPTARLGGGRGAQAKRYTDPERSNDLDDAVAWAEQYEQWGKYAPAIARHESCFGREAPSPLVRKQLSPDFVEWMMGYPAGWVDGVSRTAKLRLLGNSVVTRQAVAALRLLVSQRMVMA